jgi:hypothetical protein
MFCPSHRIESINLTIFGTSYNLRSSLDSVTQCVSFNLGMETSGLRNEIRRMRSRNCYKMCQDSTYMSENICDIFACEAFVSGLDSHSILKAERESNDFNANSK